MVAAWLVFEAYHGYKIPRGTASAEGVKYMEWENLQLSTEIIVYLRNSTR